MLLTARDVLTLLIFFILQYFARRLISRLRYEIGVYRHGCEHPPTLRPWDPIFNLDSIFSNLKARTEHRVLKLDQENFCKYGWTLQNPFFGRGSIQTTSVENFQAMMSTKGNNEFFVAR